MGRRDGSVSREWNKLFIATVMLGVFSAGIAEAEKNVPAPIIYANAVATIDSEATATTETATLGQSNKALAFASTSATRPVSGQVFQPVASAEYDREGVATLIAGDLAGKPTANGEIYDPNALSAAHSTLPLPSLVHIINTETGQEIVVRVNDRGPIAGGGLIEISDRAADLVGIGPAGEGRVRLRYLGAAPALSEKSEQLAKGPSIAPSSSLTVSTSIRTDVQLPAQKNIESFFVQLGSFSDISNAQRLHGRTAPRLAVMVVPVNVRGNDFFRVLAGPFQDRLTASVTRDRLAAQGVADGVVISAEN